MANGDKTTTNQPPKATTDTENLVGFAYQTANAITVALQDVVNATKPVRDRIVACKDTGCSTNKKFYDIIYLPQKRCFWLINKTTADSLGKAANDFNKAITLNVPEQRLEALSKYKITELFLTPDMFSFLTDAEQKEYKEQQKIVHDVMEEQQRKINEEGIFNRAGVAQSDMLVTGLPKASTRVIELRTLAIQRARAKGYIISGDKVYSKAQVDVKKYLTDYTESIESIKTIKGDKYENIFTAITYYQALIENYTKQSYDAQSTTYNGEIVGFTAYLEYLKYKQNSMNGQLANHINLINKLADLGIAVPEYAFCPQDTQTGIKDFLAYLNLVEEKEDKQTELESEFKSWREALGNKASLVPTDTFEKDILEILEINDQIIEKRKIAEKKITDSPVPMFCVWEPEQFKLEPVEFLFKAVNPLQEYSTPKKGNESLGLAHLSIAALSERIEEDLTNLLTKGEVASLNDNDNEIELFERFLKENQAKPIAIDEKKWFYKDENSNMSIFSYVAFFDYLKQENLQVETLSDEATQKTWGEKLQKIIFSSEVIHNIMLFDTSPGAALIRSLTLDPKMLATKFESSGPSLKLGASEEDDEAIDNTNQTLKQKQTHNIGVKPKSQLATATITSVETKIMVAPLKGEVTLLDITFPPEGSTLREFDITYTDKDNQQKTVHLGEFFINFVAKAWGFAGASLMLGGDLSLGVNKSQFSLSSAYKASSKQLNAKVDIFLGVQAGIKLLGELRWLPPVDLRNFAETVQINRKRKFNYRIVSRLEVSAAVAAGAGWTAEFGFGLLGGKFYFYMKAKLIWGVGASGNIAFEIDYDSLADILTMLCLILKDAQYKKLEFVDQSAFEYLTTACSLFVMFGSPIFWVSRTLPELMEIYKTVTGVGNVDKIAARIARKQNEQILKPWVKLLPPESLGPLLFSLTEIQTEWDFPSIRRRSPSVTGLQQQAISNLLTWITEGLTDFSSTQPNTAQLLFEKSLARMNILGYRADKPKTTYCENLARLNNFMSFSSDLTPQQYGFLKKNYDIAIEKLNKHMAGKCVRVKEFQPMTSGMSQQAIYFDVWKYTGTEKDE